MHTSESFLLLNNLCKSISTYISDPDEEVFKENGINCVTNGLILRESYFPFRHRHIPSSSEVSQSCLHIWKGCI